MNNKGQSVLSEHVMIFFVVIAAIVAMTTFVQRSFEARIHDARNFMINSANSVCDADCQRAAGGNVGYEYEPYYGGMLTDMGHHESDYQGQTNGSAAAIGAIYINSVNEQTNTEGFSCQLPPICATMSGPLPCYCICPNPQPCGSPV